MSNENDTEVTDLNIEISKALGKHKDTIVAGLVEGAIQTLNRDLGWKAANAAGKVIDDFMKTDVLPKLQEELEARKPQIVAALISGIEASVAKGVEQMTATAAKNLSSSWNMKKLTEAMFG